MEAIFGNAFQFITGEGTKLCIVAIILQKQDDSQPQELDAA